MKKTTKLLLAVLVVAVLCLSLAACDNHEHTYGDWTLTTAPTLTTEGSATRTCTGCEEKETVTVPALTDTSVWTATPNPAPTHTSAGKTDYTSVYGKVTVDVAKLGDEHTFNQKVVDAKYLKSEATCLEAAVYYYSCVCGESSKDHNGETFTDGEPLGHNYKFDSWKTKPTLTAGGVAQLKCEKCNDLKEENVASLADETVWTKVASKHVDATCTAEGKDVYASESYGEVEVVLAKLAHSYAFVSWATEPTLTAGGVANLKCANCTDTKTENVAELGDETVWTATVTAATYEADAYTTYTATVFGSEQKFTITDENTRLVAVFENKLYKGGMLFGSQDTFASENVFIDIGAKGVADDTFNKKNFSSSSDDGYGEYGDYGPGAYSNQKIKFAVVDAAKGTITVTFTWTETSSGTSTDNTEVYNGYVSADGKYIVFDRYKVNDTSAGFSAYYVLVQVDSKDTAVSLKTVYPYDTNVGKVVGLTVNGKENVVFKYNGTFYFGATLSDLAGETLTVAQSKTANNVVVKDATGARIAGFVLVEYQDDEGRTRTRFAETDGLDGTYTNGEETATLDGNGKLTVNGSGYSFAGTYKRAEAGAAYTLDVFLEEGTSKAYYQVTLGENYTYTRVKPTGTVNYVLNDGTLGAHETEINIGVAYTLPVPTREGYFFAGWYLTAEPESVEEARTDATIALGQTEITVYAIWTKPVKVVYNGLIGGGTQNTEINIGEAILSKAPADYIADVTLNADKTKGFKGWYFDAEFNTQASEENIADLLMYSGDTINLYAKWETLATVTLKYGHLIADKETHLVKNAQFSKALAAEDNLKYNNGRPFEAWYVDVNKNGVIDDGDYAVDDGTLVADGMVFIAKWNENVSWRIDNSDKYTFVYDAADGQWKSNNKGVNSSSASLKIFPIGGEIEVSFKFWASSESADQWDFATVWYYADGTTTTYTSKKYGGQTATASDAEEYKLVLSERTGTTNAPLYFTYQKDSGGKGGSDTAYIIDLTINGVKVTTAGSPDFLDGYYTREGGEKLTLDGFGGLTLGSEKGTYTLASENAGYTAVANVGGKTYKLTLSGNTYSLVEYNATISFNFGKIEATLANVSVPFGSTYTIPKGPTVSGYTFRGWYKEAAFTNKVTSITADKDEIVLYAKYDAAVTVTYNYLDGGAHENGVENLFVNDQSATVPTVDFTFGTKVFAGWFTANGTEGGDWGTEFTNGTTVTESITVYAKWVEPHALAGSYKGAEFDPSESSIALTTKSSLGFSITIDNFGKVTGSKKGTIENYNTENGTFVLVDGSSRYNGYADIANGIVEIDYYAGRSTNEHDIYLFFAVNGDVTPASAESVSWTKGTVKIATIRFSNDTTKNLLVYNRVVYANVTWSATDSSGATLTTMTDISKNMYVITVTAGENTYSFARNSSNDAVAQDGTQGAFTCEGKENLILNGAGIASGALSGTYTAADEGAGYTYDVTTTDGQYKVTIIGSTYTVEDNRVTITFVNEHKEIASVTPFYGKSVTLPSGNEVAVEGYKFRGWYDNAEFTGSAMTSVTLTADATYYAKYEAIVNITFDYSGYEYETGKTTKVVDTLASGDTLGNTIPTVDATVVFEGKVFAGWFAKSGDDWGEQATSSTKVTAAVTYYAKWMEPAASMGTYKGFEIYSTWSKESIKPSDKIITISADGKFSGKVSGTLSSEDMSKTDGSIMVGRYGYVCAEGDVIVIAFSGSNTTTWGNDAYIGFRNSDSIKTISYSCAVVGGKLVTFMTISYNDNTTKNLLVANDEIIYNVTFSVNGEACNGYDCASKNGVLISKNGTALYVWKDKTLVGSDGKAGTYTGEYGEIVVDGYGTVTIGSETTVYTLDGNNITFVIGGKKSVVVALGEGTYTKVSDGYNGTYTLPDNAGTITLDGFGGAGGGKTYVVSGTNITIFDGATSTTYGLDVAKKTLLGKSIFAGLKFVSSTYKVVFDDSTSITGKFTSTAYPSYEYGFTGTIEGNVLTITITSQNYAMGFIGTKITATVENGKITFTSSFKYDNVTDIKNTSATCESFVFGN
ncbi:MAG TPA: hypothetical protein DHU79_05630 [Clostridiales bacterium]|nr:hypothetical protein [Clostridiales bacterium]